MCFCTGWFVSASITSAFNGIVSFTLFKFTNIKSCYIKDKHLVRGIHDSFIEWELSLSLALFALETSYQQICKCVGTAVLLRK